MTSIFLIQIGDWIAKIDNPYSMTAAIFFGVCYVLKYLILKPLAERTHIDIIKTLNRGMTFGFIIAVLGLFVTVALSFINSVNLNSKYEHELAMIDNVSGEYNGVINGKSYFVTIKLDSIGNDRPVDKVNMYEFDYLIKPSDLISPESGRGKLITQRTNFWEGKEFTIDFSNSVNMKNMIGTLKPQEVGDIHYYRIEFNKQDNFLLKQLK